MKIDMHCHVKEGSIDSRVGIEEYIEILKKKGFQGMVITDHDTYNGYRYWKENIKGKLYGIIQAMSDAGYAITIYPTRAPQDAIEQIRNLPDDYAGRS